MGRFVKRGDTTRLDLGDGDWVELKSALSVSDRAAISAATVHGSPQDQQVDLGAATLATLNRCVVAWGGPGFCVKSDDHEELGTEHSDGGEGDCKPTAINPGSLGSLGDDTGQKMLAALYGRQENVEPSDEETANP